MSFTQLASRSQLPRSDRPARGAVAPTITPNPRPPLSIHSLAPTRSTWFMRNSRSPKTITVMGAGAGSGAAAGAGASHSGAAEHPELHGAAAASDKGPETQVAALCV